jgi:hypothetical protein
MKTIVMRAGKRQTLHVETPLGIVNIETGLVNAKGRRVDAVLFHPNAYAGENKVRLVGTRFVECRRARN